MFVPTHNQNGEFCFIFRCGAAGLAFVRRIIPDRKRAVKGNAIESVIQSGEDQLLLGIITFPLGIEHGEIVIEAGFEALL